MHYFYFLLLLLTSLLWAGNFIVGKFLVDHASPMTLTTLRWIIAVVCLFPVVWWTDKKLLPPRKAILPLFFMGITGVVLFNILLFVALEQTSATNVGLISTLIMISIAFFSFLFLKEKMNVLQVIAMGFSLFGVFLVLTKGNSQLFLSLTFNKGDLYMMLAVCIWGAYAVFSKWAMTHTSPMMATLYSGVFGLLVLLPFTIKDLTISNLNSTFMYSIFYTGVISTVVCMVLWNIGVKKLGATVAGTFLNFNPVFTAILAFFFLGERMTAIQIIGSAIVIFSCYFFSYFKEKPAQIRRMVKIRQAA